MVIFFYSAFCKIVILNDKLEIFRLFLFKIRIYMYDLSKVYYYLFFLYSCADRFLRILVIVLVDNIYQN